MAAKKNLAGVEPLNPTPMSPRLARLAAETRTPEPYPVTDNLTVMPPTRTRNTAMVDAETEIYLLNSLLEQAMSRVIAPKPTQPEDATDEQREAFAAELAAWEQQIADTEGVAAAINAKIADARNAYERAFFGDAHDAVMEYFEDKPLLWNKFSVDIRAEFLPPAPDDGICPTCGHIDEEQAGKASSSST